VFDPFFALFLLAGPLLLLLLIWMELRRKTSSVWPALETYLLGFIAAFALSHWLTFFAVERYGDGMSAAKFELVALLSFAAAAGLVIVIYVVIALIRKRRNTA
jgi:hypothetical protein